MGFLGFSATTAIRSWNIHILKGDHGAERRITEMAAGGETVFSLLVVVVSMFFMSVYYHFSSCFFLTFFPGVAKTGNASSTWCIMVDVLGTGLFGAIAQSAFFL